MTDGRLEATSNIITATDSTVELDLSRKLRVACYLPPKGVGARFLGFRSNGRGLLEPKPGAHYT